MHIRKLHPEIGAEIIGVSMIDVAQSVLEAHSLLPNKADDPTA